MADSEDVFQIRGARRHATPQVMSIYGPTFSGKTYGALMLAAGLIKPGQKIGFLDTEMGRGLMYSDDPDVRAAIPRESWLPTGEPYGYIELNPPFHPRRYITALRTFQEAGYSLIITDSGSHAWSEEGGALDMKEHDKSWVQAKLWTKRFSSALRYSPCHQIVCLRAQEKTKIITGDRGKQIYVPIGVMPICEKSFPFDLGLAFSVEGEVDGKPATHLATAMKWPKGMNGLFNDWKPQLLTADVGRRIREWNETAPPEDLTERLAKQAKSVAEEGMVAYEAFFKGLTPAQRTSLKPFHAENKAIAESADKALPRYDDWPAWDADGSPAHPVMFVAGERYVWDAESTSHKKAA